MARYLLSILFLFLSVQFSYGQLKVSKEQRLVATDVKVFEFIKANNFEYALITWDTPNGLNSHNLFSCLLRQNGSWYLARISSPAYTSPVPQIKISVQQTRLAGDQADSLMSIFKPDSAFSITQEDLYKLPDPCYYMENGKHNGMGRPSHGVRNHLVQFSKGGTSSLSFYATERFLEKCYPYVAKFRILKGFVNTFTGLSKAVKNTK